jgi:hypothetical protein
MSEQRDGARHGAWSAVEGAVTTAGVIANMTAGLGGPVPDMAVADDLAATAISRTVDCTDVARSEVSELYSLPDQLGDWAELQASERGDRLGDDLALGDEADTDYADHADPDAGWALGGDWADGADFAGGDASAEGPDGGIA